MGKGGRWVLDKGGKYEMMVAEKIRGRKKGAKRMKKIPTLFVREFENGKLITTGRVPAPGCEWVLDGKGEATEKVDGSACAILGGVFYRRYDARWGRPVPVGAIPCQPDPDPVTGHWPHWVRVDFSSRADMWYAAAYNNTPWGRSDGTYEAVGPHFQGNPYGLETDVLERHGRKKLRDCPRTFDGIQEYLRTHEIEGIVFWLDGEPGCKIKRSDFKMEWPVKEGK